MSRKFRNSRRQIGKLGLRTILVVSVVAAGSILTAALLLINIFRDEKTLADSNPMVVSEIEVFQDLTPVLKGASMQSLLGIKVVVKGNAKKLQLSSFQFTTVGTSHPIEKIIINTRLWSTGFQAYFSPIRQLGAALPNITEENFTMNAGIPLSEGENYFWLTCDIGDKIAGKELKIRTGLVTTVIGTLTFEPDRITQQGSKRIVNNQPYFSISNGDISAIDKWSTTRDGSGRHPQSFSENGATFCIQAGHILTNTLNACLPALIIERNGVLRSSTSIKAEYVDIQAGGTFIQQKEVLAPNSLNKFIIRNNGNFIQLHSGALPGKVKQFEPYSTVTLNNYSYQTFELPISWGNLVIDTKDSNPVDFSNCFRTIRGDLEIRATGTEGYLYTSSSDTIQISGSLYIKGGRLALAPGGNETTLIVKKDFILDKGWFSDLLPNKQGNGKVKFFVGSLVYLKSGNFKMTGKESEMYFTKNKVTYSQSETVVILPDVTIMENSALTIAGKKMGIFPTGKQLHIMKDAILNTCVSIVEGEGLLFVDDFATLSTEHQEGINSIGLKGCIRTAKRYYSSKANYAFVGATTPQYSGIFKTMPQSETMNNLVISKARITDVVILEQPVLVKGRLLQHKGNINKNSFALDQGEKRNCYCNTLNSELASILL
ncbi:MAG: hypothetical protein IPP71_00895 [Bacteroidetes bacterium]|nr:hypothetical protein [Bacteroidota bacterium]